MSKELGIKEMESVIRDILSPYNDKDPAVEAWLLVEQEGWHRQKEGKWLFAGDGIVDCSNCEEAYDATMLPRNYCPNCGAKMVTE